MAVTYTWDCRSVDTYPTYSDDNSVDQSDVIFNVHWRLTGTEGEHSYSMIGSQNLDISDLSSFTGFDAVTHDNVIAWVEAAMEEEMLTNIKTNIANEIAELTTPTVVARRIEDAAE